MVGLAVAPLVLRLERVGSARERPFYVKYKIRSVVLQDINFHTQFALRKRYHAKEKKISCVIRKKKDLFRRVTTLCDLRSSRNWI
jgi:hypothetical protein